MTAGQATVQSKAHMNAPENSAKSLIASARIWNLPQVYLLLFEFAIPAWSACSFNAGASHVCPSLVNVVQLQPVTYESWLHKPHCNFVYDTCIDTASPEGHTGGCLPL